jgi:hypothetical protein
VVHRSRPGAEHPQHLQIRDRGTSSRPSVTHTRAGAD